MASKKIGLALGGGAARGIAHVGVIKGLLKHGFSIDFIAGTSAGAVVGGLFAAGMSIDDMLLHLPELTWRDFAGFHLSRKGMVSSKPIEQLVRRFVGKKTFKDLKVPFCALATDILLGHGVDLCDPDLDLADAIRASASFPGIYSPMEIDGRYYFDGGAAANVPSVSVRNMGAEVVIAVDVIPKVQINHLPKHIALLTDRGLDLLLQGVSAQHEKHADIVLRPVKDYCNSFQVKRSRHLVEWGEESVTENLDRLKELVS